MTRATNTEDITTAGSYQIANEPCERVSIQVISTGDATYTVEHTLAPSKDAWLPNDIIVNETGNSDGNYIFPVAGIRLTVHSITTGTVCMYVLGE